MTGSWLSFAAVATAAMLAELRPTAPTAASPGLADATQPLESLPSDISSGFGHS